MSGELVSPGGRGPVIINHIILDSGGTTPISSILAVFFGAFS